ncbi:tRNA uracil 4-sulfurtransferase ThiI [Candidatus Hartigia pinicola]
MKFIIKLFPEITIKSQTVRIHFIKILASNIRHILSVLHQDIVVVRHWDKITVRVKEKIKHNEICDRLSCIPGIHHILEVEETSFTSLHHIYEIVHQSYIHSLENKTFCVRVKRRGKHTFTSSEAECYIGGKLNQAILSSKVNLTNPDITVNLKIENKNLILVKARYEGIKGFPIGTQEDVLSLISGGFDSGVSSYMLMRRGCRVHYCFFNLGGEAHEIGVKKIAYYLWNRFSSSHKVHFVTINFEPVIGEILAKIDDSQMGIVLKRMMVRAASKVAKHYGIQAIVTGEALGQVSSQTLTNLNLINNAYDILVLRPLISHDKEHIIKLARQIGTEHFAKIIPEYCGVISKNPTVKSSKAKIEKAEANFNFSILDEVITQSKHINVHRIIQESRNKVIEIKMVKKCLTKNEIILDIRSPNDHETKPLLIDGVEIKYIPFYQLSTKFHKLPKEKTYLLYCDRGVMSHLQALSLQEQGFSNVKVYRP